MYAAHMDAHIYSYYSHLLMERYSEILRQRGISDSVLAYRSLKKSNIEFAKEAFDAIRRIGDCTVLCFDVKSFFDKLNHEYMKRKWMEVLNVSRLPNDHFAVFEAVTKFAYVKKDTLFSTFDLPKGARLSDYRRICSPAKFRYKVRSSKMVKTNSDPFGIPQGSPISSTLSNIYMLDFDVAINDCVKAFGGRYWRYADDILIIVPTNEKDKLSSLVAKELKKIELKASPKKTEEAIFKDGRIQQHSQGGVVSQKDYMQYLGFIFDGTTVRIRPASITKFYRRMKRGIRAAKRNSAKMNVPVSRKRIYDLYSHLGHRNFISYAYRAAEIMKSKAIRRQVAKHMELIDHYLQTV